MEILNKILQKFKQPNEWWGIHIELVSNEVSYLYAVKLSRIKEQVQITEKYTKVFDAKSLKDIIDSKIPIALSINGKGILHKKISIDANDTVEQIINQVLPGAKSTDFYFQKVKATNNAYYLSICRKDAIEKILTSFQEKSKEIIACSLGPFELNNIVPLIKFENTQKICFLNYSTSFIDSVVDKFEKIDPNNTISYSVGDEIIESEYLIPFAVGLSVIINTEIIADFDFADSNYEEYQQKNIFTFSSKSILTFIFLILLINFIIYNKIFRENTLLNSSIKNDVQSLNKIDSLRKDILEKESYLKQTGWLEISKTSYFADRIVSVMPKEIKLKDLLIYPPDKEKIRKEQQEMIFQNHKIFISGIIHESSLLNIWVDSLKKMNWVNEVNIDKFYIDEHSNLGNFEMIIFKK